MSEPTKLPLGAPPKDPVKRAAYDAQRQAAYAQLRIPDPGVDAPRHVRAAGREAIIRAARAKRNNARRLVYEARWLAGETYREIGETEGLTRERIRQVLDLPSWLVNLKHFRDSARKRLRRYVASDPLLPDMTCPVCGVLVRPATEHTRDSRAYCSAVHREVVLQHLRYLLASWDNTTDQRHIHKRATLRYQARDDSAATPYQRQYARDILAGRRPWPRPATETRNRGRWFVTDSMNYWIATGLYLRGWPLFDDLAPELQAQIRAEAPKLSIKQQAKALCTLDAQPTTMQGVYVSALRAAAKERTDTLRDVATALRAELERKRAQ